MGTPHATVTTATRKLAVIGAATLLLLGAAACDFPYSASVNPDTTTATGADPAATTNRAAPETSMAATPELDSLVLFAAGLVGAAGFLRRRCS